MNDLGDTGQSVPTHYGVLISLGDSAGAGDSVDRPLIGWIASGDESTCWAAIEQWTATHRPRAGEHAEVLARARAPVDERERVADERDLVADEREDTADEREQVADERDLVADERDAAADRREAVANERERDLDRRRAELSEHVRGVQATTSAAVIRSLEVLDDARARLARTKAALERSREQVQRVEARARREQAGIDRQVATTRRNAATRARPARSATTNDEQPVMGTAAPERAGPAPRMPRPRGGDVP